MLWVYNSEFDVVREVELVPTRGWGGEGAVGAELGYGALHRLPVGLGEEVDGPGEVVFETRDDGTSAAVVDPSNPTMAGPGNFLVPANMASPPPLSSASPDKPPAGRRGTKARHQALASPNRAFDEYFAEAELKSREQDFAPSRKGSPLPPPPPPKASISSPSSANATPAGAEESTSQGQEDSST